MYKYYRSTPLVRAYGLEKALGTPAHIYFKNESVSPIGSHKLNSALAQAYYCKKKVSAILQPKPEPDNGEQPFRMPQKYSDWRLPFIR